MNTVGAHHEKSLGISLIVMNSYENEMITVIEKKMYDLTNKHFSNVRMVNINMFSSRYVTGKTTTNQFPGHWRKASNIIMKFSDRIS